MIRIIANQKSICGSLGSLSRVLKETNLSNALTLVRSFFYFLKFRFDHFPVVSFNLAYLITNSHPVESVNSFWKPNPTLFIDVNMLFLLVALFILGKRFFDPPSASHQIDPIVILQNKQHRRSFILLLPSLLGQRQLQSRTYRKPRRRRIAKRLYGEL